MDYLELIGKIEPLEIGRDVFTAELSELGFESFVDFDEGIKAYIQNTSFNEFELKKLKIFCNPEFNIEYELNIIAEQNWNAEWEKSFDAINVDNRCLIRAEFHEKIDNIDYDIIINPKMSFGTGHHATTYLMVKKLLELDLNDKRVMDMGCGTGVLAILAAKKNAKYIEAIDIDEWSYNNTIENIRNNNCNNIVAKHGEVELLGGNTFDVFLANINRNILMRDMPKYIENIEDQGVLLLSGFFNSDQDLLLLEAERLGMKKVSVEIKNDWIMLHLVKE